MIKIYYTTLDNMILALNIKFNQETIEIIKSIASLLNLQIISENINLLQNAFNVDNYVLKTKIDLLKHTADLPNNENINISK